MPKFDSREELVKFKTAHAMHREPCPLAQYVMRPTAPGFPDWSECTCT